MINKTLSIIDYRSIFNSSRIELLNNLIKLNNNNHIDSNNENELLSKIDSLNEEEKESLFRKIFDLSRKIGLEILNETGYLETKQIIKTINELKIPCIDNSFEFDEKTNSAKSTRKTCICNANETSCQYWRESLDGLIMGLGDNERYVRYQSILYGKNDSCVDVIYDSSINDMKWGEIPDEISDSLKKTIKKYQEKAIQIILKGLNEKTLYFQIKDKSDNASGFRRHYVLENFEQIFKKKFPNLNLCEISPRAVIEGEF